MGEAGAVGEATIGEPLTVTYPPDTRQIPPQHPARCRRIHRHPSTNAEAHCTTAAQLEIICRALRSVQRQEALSVDEFDAALAEALAKA